jgi:hypothetical protein
MANDVFLGSLFLAAGLILIVIIVVYLSKGKHAKKGRSSEDDKNNQIAVNNMHTALKELPIPAVLNESGTYKSNSSSIAMTREVVSSKGHADIIIPNFKLHDDIKGLIWIGDGKYKNYTPENKYGFTKEYNGIRITFTCNYGNEPSVVYTKQPVDMPQDETVVPRPPYYPTYTGLTPEQKWVYLKLLENPYNTSIDIGYVFILYYGLERHLLSGDFERAFKVILKLRDVHTNGSFQAYSANALILSAMLHEKGEYILEFIKSLDKDYELNFWNNLLLISYYSFKIPLYPKDIMRMSASFGFENKNYIKKYPEIFEGYLREVIHEKTGKDTVLINECISSTEIQGIELSVSPIFANTSMNDQRIPVPLLSENLKLRNVICGFLGAAHEMTKKKLAELRKTNKAPEPAYKPQKREKIPEMSIFSISDETIKLSNDKLWINRINDNELMECFSRSKRNVIKLDTHLSDILNKYIKYLLFRELLEELPLTLNQIASYLKEIINKKNEMQNDIQDIYKMIYSFHFLSTAVIPYSEKLEMPGYNVIDIMPGGSLIKLPMPYAKIGYEKLGLNKSTEKLFRELWGIPEAHNTFNELYPEIWNYYESHYKRISRSK